MRAFPVLSRVARSLSGRLLLAGLLVGLALPARAEARARRHTFKIATILPQGGPWAAELARFSARVKRRTRGKVIFKLYFGAVAGTDRRAIARMRTGQIQGVAAATAALSNIVPSVRVLELPMLYDSYKEFWFVQRSMQPEFARRFGQRGYTLLAMAGIGWVYIFSKLPMNSLEDFKHRKIWRWRTDPMAAALFQLVGVQGYTMSPNEVLPALQAGTLDTVYGMPHFAQAMQWHTTLSYMLDLRITMAIAGIIVRKDAFDRMSPELRRLVSEEARTMQRRLNLGSKVVNRKARRAMIASGLKAVRPAGTFLQKLNQIRRKVWRVLRGRLYQPADLKKIQALLTLCRNSSCRL